MGRGWRRRQQMREHTQPLSLCAELYGLRGLDGVARGRWRSHNVILLDGEEERRLALLVLVVDIEAKPSRWVLGQALLPLQLDQLLDACLVVEAVRLGHLRAQRPSVPIPIRAVVRETGPCIPAVVHYRGVTDGVCRCSMTCALRVSLLGAVLTGTHASLCSGILPS